MSNFDPFGIEKYHEEVLEKIERNEPGYAQSEVGSQIVSYNAHGFPGSITHAHPFADPRRDIGSIMEELILDVAAGDGRASDQTFSHSRIEWMIKDRRAYPKRWTKKHRQAELLEKLLANRPEVFTDH